MAPFFSVVVPSYNRARMLRTALRTVQYQTFRDWECIIVDDGSTDGTDAVVSGFSEDGRFHRIRSDANQGMNASRNLALTQAQGAFVTFLDSDDLWLPARLQEFHKRIEAAPETGFLFSNAYLWRYGRVVGTLFDPRRDIPEGKVPGWYAVGDRWLPYVTTNVAIRREAFDRWGRFRTEMRTLDTELFARFLAGGLLVAAIKEPLAVRRLHEGQLTVRYAENFEESMQALASSGAPEDARRDIRRRVAQEVALYLVKAGRPAEARAFLADKLGPDASKAPAWRWGLLPTPLLRGLRLFREVWLRSRHHPLVDRGNRAILEMIQPLLEDEHL